jgi:hypothetical protein
MVSGAEMAHNRQSCCRQDSSSEQDTRDQEIDKFSAYFQVVTSLLDNYTSLSGLQRIMTG